MANYVHLTATSQVKVGAGKLKSIFVSSGTVPTVAVYDTDSGATTTTIIAQFTAATPGLYLFTGGDDGLYFNKGVYVVLGGTSPKVTIAYA